MQSRSRRPGPDDPAPAAAACPAPGDEPWQTTRVSKTLWPPQAGTKRLRERYGAALVCVRYRHDRQGTHRYTTIELMVDHGPVRMPRGGRQLYELDGQARSPALEHALMDAGATWDADAGVWRMSLPTAARLGLAKRVRRAQGRA